MTSSTIRYGEGVTKEVGMDMANRNVKKVCLMTDKNLIHLPTIRAAFDSLAKNNIQFEVFDNVHVEPTDSRYRNSLRSIKSIQNLQSCRSSKLFQIQKLRCLHSNWRRFCY